MWVRAHACRCRVACTLLVVISVGVGAVRCYLWPCTPIPPARAIRIVVLFKVNKNVEMEHFYHIHITYHISTTSPSPQK